MPYPPVLASSLPYATSTYAALPTGYAALPDVHTLCESAVRQLPGATIGCLCTTAGTCALHIAYSYNAEFLLADMLKVERSIHKYLGEAEETFIQGTIPLKDDNGDIVEGFLDLLAAYEALIREAHPARDNLDSLATWRQRITLRGGDMAETRQNLERLKGLRDRAKRTVTLAHDANEHSRRTQLSVILRGGYHPSGSLPWHCPVPRLDVTHIWIYNENGVALTEKNVQRLVAMGSNNPGTYGYVGLFEAVGRGTPVFKKWVYNSRKVHIPMAQLSQYSVAVDPFTGYAYLRVLPVVNGRVQEPVRRAWPEWPDLPEDDDDSDDDSADTAPSSSYYPPSHSAPVPAARAQPSAIPHMNTGLRSRTQTQRSTVSHGHGHVAHLPQPQPQPHPHPHVQMGPPPVAVIPHQAHHSYPPPPAQTYSVPHVRHVPRNQQPGPSSGMRFYGN